MYSTPIAGGPLAFIRHGGASRPIEMTYSEAAINEARNAMVDDLVRRRIIRTPAVERAFRRVRRHAFMTPPYTVATDSLAEEFVETDDPCAVYADATVALKPEKNIHCLSPGVLAREIEALGVAEGMRILHVETGGGYYTAVLGEIVGERGSVVGINYEEDIAEMAAAFLAKAGYTNVNILSGDGAAGVPEAGPFDRVLISAGASDIAPAWIEQLYDDGRVVLPLCHLGPLGPRISGGVILAVEKTTDGLTGNISSVAVFVPLQGIMAPTTGESVSLAEGLQRWFALEEFYRTELPIRRQPRAFLPSTLSACASEDMTFANSIPSSYPRCLQRSDAQFLRSGLSSASENQELLSVEATSRARRFLQFKICCLKASYFG